MRCGFTLIELLTVMGIMVTMAGIAVGAYFAFMRGAGMRSAIGHLRSNLLLARQMAVMESKPAYVIFGMNGDQMYYTTCLMESTVTGVGAGGVMQDRYGDLSAIGVGTIMFNLSNSKSSPVVSVTRQANGTWVVVTGDPIWSIGALYGWARTSTLNLPKGFLFGNGGAAAAPETVVFNSDGGTRLEGYEMDLYEAINPNYVVRIRVQGLTGFVDVEFP